MSAAVENRVVKLDLQNTTFEHNANVSLKTLEKIKEGTNFEGMGKGLEGMSGAAKGLNNELGPIASAVQNISDRFNGLGAIGFTVLNRLTNQVMDFGQRLLQDLAIGPIKQGWEEYELELNSVQTIMNSTGRSVDDVNQYLGELNTYADKTIYSFSDMTSSIGKFTNNNVSLEDSVAAIEGISNAAAYAGASTQQASSAMYNFSQALSTGYLGLLDWKSIELAGMATTQFKECLTETALEMGTLVEKNGEYISTTTDANGHTTSFSKTMQGFRDSLSGQWITSDVLIATLKKYTDETTELGQAAEKSATEIKTFSQLMDTTKEAIGTGWASTFKILFGDLEESKQLWTSVGNVIGKFVQNSAEARNNLLQHWKDWGGREALIQGLTNIFNSFYEIVRQVGTAFREIFPPMTAKTLYDLTVKFKEFTDKLRPTPEVLDRVKRIFKGLFAAIDIVIAPIRALISVAGKGFGIIGKALAPIGNVILEALAVIGDFIVALDDLLVKGKSFDEVGENLKGTFSSIGEGFDGLKKKFEVFKGIFKGLPNIFKFDGSKQGLEGLKANITQMGLFGEASEKAYNILSKFTKVFSKIKEAANKVFSPIVDFVKNKIIPGFQKMRDAIKNVGLENWLKIFNTGFRGVSTGGFLVLIGKIISAVKQWKKLSVDLQKALTGLVESLSGTLNALTDTLSAMQKKVKADAIKKIAVAIAILAGSAIALSMVKPEKLRNGIVAIGAIMGELVVMMRGLNWAMKKMDTKGIIKATGSLIPLAIAIGILGTAMTKVGKLKFGEVVKGIIGLAGAAVILMGSAFFMPQYNKGMLQSALSLWVLAGAIKKLGKAMKIIGEMKFQEWVQGLVGLGVVFEMLIQFLKRVDANERLAVGSGFALMELAVAIAIFGGVVKQIGSLPIRTAIKGLGGMGTILLELGVFFRMIDKAMTAGQGFAMIELGIAMNVLAYAIQQLGQMKLKDLGTGLVGVGGGLMLMALALRILGNSGASFGSGAALLGAGVAIGILALALWQIAKLPIEAIVKGLIAIGVSMGLIWNFLPDGSKAVAGAAAFIIVSTGLVILAGALALFQKLNVGTIVKGLAAFGVVLAGLLVAGIIVDKVPGLAIGLLALAGAIAAIGAGIGVASIGLAMLLAAILSLSTMGGAAIDQLIENLHHLAKEVPAIIAEFAVNMLKNAGTVIKTFCETLITYLPMLIETGITLIMTLLEAIRDNIGPIVTVVADIIYNFTEALAANLDKIIQAGWDLIIALIDGIGDGIEENAERLREALEGLCMKIANAFLTFFGKGGKGHTEIKDAGNGAIDALKTGMKNQEDETESTAGGIGGIVTNVIGGMFKKGGKGNKSLLGSGGDAVSALQSGINNNTSGLSTSALSAGGIISSTVSGYFGSGGTGQISLSNSGYNVDKYLGKGVTDNKKTATDASKTISKAVTGSFSSYFSSDGGTGWDSLTKTGGNIIAGLKNGMSVKKIISAGTSVGKKLIDAINAASGVGSPSKYTYQTGKFILEGLANGLSKTTPVEDSMRKMGSSIISLFNDDILSTLNDTPSPTITPVLNLDEVRNGAASINNLFPNTATVGMAAAVANGGFTRVRAAKNFAEENRLAKVESKLDQLASQETPIPTNNNTFNIQSTDPKKAAEEVGYILQRQLERGKAAWAR